MLEGETRHEQKSNQTDILKEDRPEFGSRLDREAWRTVESTVILKEWFPKLSLQVLESLTTLQRKLESYCGECTNQQVRVRVSADDWITKGKGPPLFLLTQKRGKLHSHETLKAQKVGLPLPASKRDVLASGRWRALKNKMNDQYEGPKSFILFKTFLKPFSFLLFCEKHLEIEYIHFFIKFNNARGNWKIH